MLIPVILAGGVGSRLWPLSSEAYPKQFLQLTGWQSLLQETMTRLDQSILHEPIVVTNARYEKVVHEQLQQINMIDKAQLIVEPAARGTAPAIALAALSALAEGDDPSLLILPTDHAIDHLDTFYESLLLAYELAEHGKLVTFGIKPKVAASGYGYIKRGDVITANKAYDVAEFVEKPSTDVAASYLESGQYYWNSGMFLVKASVFLDELAYFEPSIFQACKAAFEQRQQVNIGCLVDSSAFAKSPTKSVDYAVFENTEKAVVLPLDISWRDLGSWESIYALSEQDEAGNVIDGDVLTIGTNDSLIKAGGKTLRVIGLKNTVIVVNEDDILIADRAALEKVDTLK